MPIISVRQSNIFAQGKINSQTVRIDDSGFVKGNIIIGDYSEIMKLFGAFHIPSSFYTKENGTPKAVIFNVEIYPPEFVTDENSKNNILNNIKRLVGSKDVDIVGPSTATILDLPDGGIEVRLKMFYPEFLVVTPTSYSQPSNNKIKVSYHK